MLLNGDRPPMTWRDGRNEISAAPSGKSCPGALKASKTRTTGGRHLTGRQETVWHKKEQRSKDMLLAGTFNPDSTPMRRILYAIAATGRTEPWR
jgi:hypothetical protein